MGVCQNSVDEYIASEKEDLESYKADLEEALEELKDMRADWKPEKEHKRRYRAESNSEVSGPEERA